MTFTDNFIVECTNIERSLKNQQFHKWKHQKKNMAIFIFFENFVFVKLGKENNFLTHFNYHTCITFELTLCTLDHLNIRHIKTRIFKS